MYKEYMNSKLGILEIVCDDNYLLSIRIVKKELEDSSNTITNKIVSQLNEYFDGKRTEFDIPINFTDSFRDKIYHTLYNVEFGTSVTYKDLAASINSKAYQAVGSAMANNPYFIVVPCHRVTNSNGEMGQFYYGTKMKEEMQYFEKKKIFDEKVFRTHYFSDEEINALKNNDKLVKMFDEIEMVKSLSIFNDPYTCLVSQVTHQLVANKLAKYGEVMLFDYLDYNITPKRLLALTDKEFKMCKVFGKRIEYIRNISQFFIDNENFVNEVYNLSEKEVHDTLIKVPGIGEWSVEMFFIFGLGKKDILSLRDLIIVRILEKFYGNRDLKKVRKEILDYGTIVSINLWKYSELHKK